MGTSLSGQQLSATYGSLLNTNNGNTGVSGGLVNICDGNGNATGLSLSETGVAVASLTAYAVICGGTSTGSALQNVSGLGTSGYVLTSNGASALPTWQVSPAGFVNPMSTLGDIIYENATPAPTRLAGTTSATKQFLTQTGTGSVSAAPAWGTIQVADVPVLNQNTTGVASNVSGVVPVTNGGTGQTSFSGAINVLLPSQSGQNGNFLTTNGSVASWANVGGSSADTGRLTFNNGGLGVNSSLQVVDDGNGTASALWLSTLGINFAGFSQNNGVPTTDIPACRLATTANLTATYSNGSSGIGATLTNSSTQVALNIDGVAASVGDRVLVLHQTSTFQNGIFSVAAIGSGSSNWVLTRTTDYNLSSQIVNNGTVLITDGNANGATLFVLSSLSNPTIGSGTISFSVMQSVADQAGKNGAVLFIANGFSPLSGSLQTIYDAASNQSTLQLSTEGLNLGGFIQNNTAKISDIPSCRVATTAGLTATYSNGTSGVGATLTNSSTQAAIVIDGVTLSVNDRVLVNNQSSTFQCGIYFVSNTGSGSSNWVLTRVLDYDTSSQMGYGDRVYVIAGTVNTGTWWSQTTNSAITVGSTAIVFAQAGTTATQTLTNKRINGRLLTITANTATPAINTDNYDAITITGQSTNITSFTSSLSGTPVEPNKIQIAITDNGSPVALSWGSSFEASGNAALPTTTVASTRLDVVFTWNSVTSKWRCVGVA